MLYIIIAILIFGVLIATHELGHFATAKLLGVKVKMCIRDRAQDRAPLGVELFVHERRGAAECAGG